MPTLHSVSYGFFRSSCSRLPRIGSGLGPGGSFPFCGLLVPEERRYINSNSSAVTSRGNALGTWRSPSSIAMRRAKRLRAKLGDVNTLSFSKNLSVRKVTASLLLTASHILWEESCDPTYWYGYCFCTWPKNPFTHTICVMHKKYTTHTRATLVPGCVW